MQSGGNKRVAEMRVTNLSSIGPSLTTEKSHILGTPFVREKLHIWLP